MGWTKRQLVEQAFEEIGYASYAYDLETEQLQAALRRLDSMMGLWSSKGVKVFYLLPASPSTSDLDDDSGLPDYAVEAVYLNLAIRLAPMVGKQVQRETKVNAKMAYNEVLKRSISIKEAKLPTSLPLGAGNKPGIYSDNFVVEEQDNEITGPDNEAEFNP